MIGSAAIGRPAAALVDIGAGASVVEQLEPGRAGALERAGSVVADAEAEPTSPALLEALALVDVAAGAAPVDRLFISVVARALVRSPRVDALVLAPVIRKVALVDVAAISTVAR